MIAGVTADNFFSQLVLLIFAVAFVSGIVIAYSRAWQYLETNQGLLQPQRRLIRIALPVTVWLLGGILCLASLFSSTNRHLYASIGLFLIAFPVLDIHLSELEYWARGAVLLPIGPIY